VVGVERPVLVEVRDVPADDFAGRRHAVAGREVAESSTCAAAMSSKPRTP
jgi:hypothetical protein